MNDSKVFSGQKSALHKKRTLLKLCSNNLYSVRLGVEGRQTSVQLIDTAGKVINGQEKYFVNDPRGLFRK